MLLRQARLMAFACKGFFACHTKSERKFPSVIHSLTSDGPALVNGLRKWTVLSATVSHFYLLSCLSLPEILAIKNSEEFCNMNNLEGILFPHDSKAALHPALSSPLCTPVTAEGFVFPNADLRQEPITDQEAPLFFIIPANVLSMPKVW